MADEVVNGLVGAGIFFLGFFIGALSVKLARRKEFKITEKDKPKVKGIMDTGISTTEVADAVKVLEQLPELEEEEAKEKDSEEVVSDAVNELKSVRD